jgi:hypothetical protein
LPHSHLAAGAAHGSERECSLSSTRLAFKLYAPKLVPFKWPAWLSLIGSPVRESWPRCGALHVVFCNDGEALFAA